MFVLLVVIKYGILILRIFRNFFSCQVQKKKISYAASAGNKLKNEWKDRYKQYLKDFFKVGVREKNAIDYFDSLYLKSGKTEACIDPTFLLNSNEYKKIAGHERLIKKKYLIYYSIKNDKESMQLAKLIGEYFNLPGYAIYSRTSSIMAMKYGMKLYLEVGL